MIDHGSLKARLDYMRWKPGVGHRYIAADKFIPSTAMRQTRLTGPQAFNVPYRATWLAGAVYS